MTEVIKRMFKQGGDSKSFSHTLVKNFGRFCQTFQKFFPTSFNVTILLNLELNNNKWAIAIT